MIKIRRVKGKDPVSYISTYGISYRFDEKLNEFEVKPEHLALVLDTGGFEVVVDSVKDQSVKTG